MSSFKTGHVSIVGRPNVGKSTLLNHLIEQKLSIVTRKPQTTRHNLLGLKTTEQSQIIFIDTPGLQKQPKQALNRHMNKAVINALNYVDIVLFTIEAMKWTELDENVLDAIKKLDNVKIILLLNKIDKVSNKKDLLPFIDEITQKISFSDILPISASKGVNLDELEALINNQLPIAPPLYPDDQVTDRSERFFAAEFLREQLMMRLGDELPYRIAITIEQFKQTEKIIHIDACIWVEKQGQKGIVIGKQGKVLKSAGSSAREDLEKLFDKKVNLKTWVKVKSKWTDSVQALKQFGYFD